MSNRKYKYAVIRNLTGNSKLAQASRGWSEERIFKELNIYIPKEELKINTKYIPKKKQNLTSFEIDGYVYKYKITDQNNLIFQLIPPKLKPLNKKRKSKLELIQQNKVTYSVKKGMDIDDAILFKLKTYKQLDKEFNYQSILKYKGKVNKLMLEERINEWSSWASQDDFPPSLVRKARLINLEKNLDINASYGFAIMYYAFTTNKTPEYFIKKYEVNESTGSIIYKVAEKL